MSLTTRLEVLLFGWLVVCAGCREDSCRALRTQVEIKGLLDGRVDPDRVRAMTLRLSVNGDQRAAKDYSGSSLQVVFELGEQDEPPYQLEAVIEAQSVSSVVIASGRAVQTLSPDGCNFMTVVASPSPTPDGTLDKPDAAPDSTPPPCRVGEPGPGGLYASCGAVPLVVTPGGCEASVERPRCDGSLDTLRLSWGPRNLPRTAARENIDGALNTVNLALMAELEDKPNHYPAALHCMNLVYRGFDDWYLPTAEELFRVLELRERAGFADSAYWTSREVASSTAFGMGSSGTPEPFTKSERLLVRCIRRASGPLPPPTVRRDVGYFVLTKTRFDGKLGGLAGAHALCLTELQARGWPGRSDAVDRNLLDVRFTQAFICADDCTSLRPNTRYLFATVERSSLIDGFFTSPDSRGPQDRENWAAAERFGRVTSYWSGRWASKSDPFLWPTAADSIPTCDGFRTNSSAAQGFVGNLNTTTEQRWGDLAKSCDTQLPLICVVHPD